ncbi:hypothetical protein [Pectobacterium polaris]|uniref:hypothetical protein n=1 Tax=Pectobacterium polaris TaxID=2042057 RepID=UPI00163C8B27|nr:hypothetical protein [Pectobacterium polaris]
MLKVSSTNTAYEPFAVDMNNQPPDFAIIGRVVWFGLVWFGLVWFGLVWFGLVWFGLAGQFNSGLNAD